MKVNRIEVLGMDWALDAMRMPYMSHGRSTAENDRSLARSLLKSGPEHRKYLRQLIVQMDVVASMAFWFEFDTYKVGTTSNSESFWNTIGNRELTMEDFVVPSDKMREPLSIIIGIINSKRLVLDREVSRYLVPQGVKYRRIVTMTAEAYLNIMRQRRNHRLGEWRTFVSETMDMLKHAPDGSDDRRLYDIMFHDFGKSKEV